MPRHCSPCVPGPCQSYPASPLRSLPIQSEPSRRSLSCRSGLRPAAARTAFRRRSKPPFLRLRSSARLAERAVPDLSCRSSPDLTYPSQAGPGPTTPVRASCLSNPCEASRGQARPVPSCRADPIQCTPCPSILASPAVPHLSTPSLDPPFASRPCLSGLAARRRSERRRDPPLNAPPLHSCRATPLLSTRRASVRLVARPRLSCR